MTAPALAPPPDVAALCAGRYGVRFARDAADLERVLRLRFEVFNRELGEGLEASWQSGLDRDRFDATCHHLLLFELDTDAVVGTYRLQTAEQARAGAGLYCDGEFELAALGPVLERGVELGRACIAAEHRHSSALFALWRGLAAYLAATRKRYLFGCCSLTSRDPREGLALWRWLAARGHLHRELRVPVRPAHACAPVSGAGDAPAVALPKLFGTYLRYGAEVCSAPALDREFGTIDFLVVLDVRRLPARLWQLFFHDLLGSPEEVPE
jgi:putative hemolysin